MNTSPNLRQTRTRKPGGKAILAACLIVATLVLPGGQPVRAAPLAQEDPLTRLPYDAPFTNPYLETTAPRAEAMPGLLEPEYANWSRLVFQSLRNQRDWEIFGVRGDGSNQVNLSNHASMDQYPRLNRDGTRVVFASNRNDNYDIFAMNANGSGQTRLTQNDANDVYPAWSPDGSKIAFQSYRNGQAEIYVMNANGSGQTRLTNFDDYDGQPVWSPDGAKIAFVRRQSGLYRIWVMNANGSNPQQRSGQPYSENPVGRPNGQQIAYDADGNGDGWQEIWLMDAGGGNQRSFYDPPEGYTDAWVHSWSPDGRYVAFTRITWVYQQGQWYWTRAYLDASDYANPYNPIRLSNNGADWNPDWQSLDWQAPTSSVQPLPVQSAWSFPVQWSGSDVGAAGLSTYDVQSKDGATGVWTNWQMATTATSASYTGVGGHSYFFRVRARDNAGNTEAWPADYDATTVVKSLPPVTAVRSLPAYVRGQNVFVAWNGNDPGNSGIQSYDIQYQGTTNGSWTDWKMGVTTTSSSFTGTPGHTYRFRSRGVDRALNMEPWPAGNGDTQTTFYLWSVDGTVRDNFGVPVQGAMVTTTPGALGAISSDATGAYTARIGAEAADYSVAIAKSGYGSPPVTAFAAYEDAEHDIVMPPVDNIVRNPGFESGSLPPDWQTTGPVPAMVTTALRHTGTSAARLGGSGAKLSEPANVSNTDQASWPSMVIDSHGTVYVAWSNGASGHRDINTVWRSGDGTWSSPPSPIITAADSTDPMLAVDSQGIVHAIWTELDPAGSYSAYAYRAPDGTWSTPERLAIALLTNATQLAVDSSDNLHVVWSGAIAIYHAWKDASGNWHTPQAIVDSAQLRYDPPRLAVDQIGQVHMTWSEDQGPMYACRPSTGAWSAPRRIAARANLPTDPILAASQDGKAHVAWSNWNDIEYSRGSCQGDWSRPQTVASAPIVPRGPDTQLAVDRMGTIHLAWLYEDWGSPAYIQYARSLDGNTWSAAQTVSGGPMSDAVAPLLAVDGDNTVHVGWNGWVSGNLHAYYTRRIGDGPWAAPENIAPDAEAPFVRMLAVDDYGLAHFALLDRVDGGAHDVFYAGSVTSSQSGDSHLTQAVTVPAASAHPGLSFLYRLGDVPGDSGSWFSTAIQTGGITTTLFTTAEVTPEWTHRWFDISPWAGQNVTLVFTLHQVADEIQPWVYLDDVTVGSTYPDLWIEKSGTSAWPNPSVVYTITYGNRGGGAATGVRVVDTLPAGLIFVSADPPPSSAGTTLTWDIGELPGAGDPFSITLTTRAEPSINFTTVTNTTAIQTQSPELETHNNTTRNLVFVGYRLVLPLIRR